jgi:dephospho-CoA kinase
MRFFARRLRVPAVIAVTGNIGSGKSTVARLLETRGAVRIDADQLARDVVAPGTAGLAAVVARFGPTVLSADGGLDRAALGRIVFDDEIARRDLEALTHPRIRDAMAARIAEALATDAPLVAVEVPLLFETGLDRSFPATLLVAAPEDVRLQRVMARDDLTAAEARARIAAQMPESEKRARATWVLDNHTGFADLTAAVDELWPTLTGG